MSTTKLVIANGALRHLKERPLTQSELDNNSREPARVFNAVWDGGARRACLEGGLWKFATRSTERTYSPSVTPEFGYTYAFEKPDDFVRIIGLWEDGTHRVPLSYRERNAYWLADLDTIYVDYVSSDDAYGYDLSLWPECFRRYVEAYIASEMEGPLTDKGKSLVSYRKLLLDEALSIDAMADPSQQLPAGSWTIARMGGRRFRRENR